MKSRARVGATLVALAATAVAALLLTSPAQAAPGATAAPTRTTLSGANIPFGAVAHLKAVVKPVVGSGKPTGTVTFSEGASVLGTVSLVLVGTVETAKLDVPGLAIGDHDFTATYNGSATFASSTSLPLTLTVGPAASVVTVAFTPKAVMGSQSVVVKASVKAKVSGTGTPAGNVTFTDGATVLGTAPLVASGTPVVYQAKLSKMVLSIGDHPIVATFVPTGGTLAGSTGTKTLTVAKDTVTVTPDKVQTADGDWYFTVQVKSTVSAAGTPTTPDTVTFFIDGLAPQTFALGASGKADTSATPLTLDPGAHTVKVVYTPAAGSVFVGNQATITFSTT